MSKSYPFLAVMIVSACIQGCATPGPTPPQTAANFLQKQHVVATTNIKLPAKNPRTVAIYTKDKTPHTAYRIIGVATVSRHNLLGIKRHEDTIHDMMKELAASIGGDGIIDVSGSEENMRANVIAFQKILI